MHDPYVHMYMHIYIYGLHMHAAPHAHGQVQLQDAERSDKRACPQVTSIVHLIPDTQSPDDHRHDVV